MKWSSMRHSERLNLGNGLISVIIRNDKEKYILTVNSKTFPMFNTIGEAKKVAEQYIRDTLSVVIKEVN